MTLGALLCSAIVLAPLASIRAQSNYTCVVYQFFHNQARKVTGPVNAECSGSWHSEPWGNWGVESNFNGRMDGDQFMGWYPGGGHHEWNSCYREYPPPRFGYFNADGGYSQETNQGVGTHAIARVAEFLYTPCEQMYFEGTIWSNGGHFMDLYELDPGDADTFIAHLEFPYAEIVFDCPYGSCYEETPWLDPSSVTPDVVTTQMKLAVLSVNEWIPY